MKLIKQAIIGMFVYCVIWIIKDTIDNRPKQIIMDGGAIDIEKDIVEEYTDN